jgi:hypothetical protein
MSGNCWYDGKVNFQTLSRFEDLGTMEDAPHLHLYTAVVWHKTLKRRLRTVVLLNRKDPARPRFIVPGSTDPDLNGLKLVELYASRFQMSFSSATGAFPFFRSTGEKRRMPKLKTPGS